MDATPTSVYQYRDAENVLLYVGITARGVSRNREHNASKDWWRFVASQTVEHFAGRDEAARRERELIRAHRPPFNRQHNPTHREMRALYLAASGGPIGDLPAEATRLFGALNHRLPLRAVGVDQDEFFLMSNPEHEALASRLIWDRPVLACAPKKVGELVRVTPWSNGAVEFRFKRSGPRVRLTAPALRVKALSQKPLRLRMHEVEETA